MHFKKLKSLNKSLKAAVLCGIILCSGAGGIITYHSWQQNRIEFADHTVHYLSENEVEEVTGYIRAEINSIVSAYHSTYSEQILLSEYLDNTSIWDVKSFILNHAAQSGIEVSESALDTALASVMVNVSYDVSINETSRDFVSNSVSERLKSYVASIDVDAMSDEALTTAIHDTIIDVLTQNADTIILDLNPTTSASDLLMQILDQIQLDVSDEQKIKWLDDFEKNISLTYKKTTMKGKVILSPEVVSQIANEVSGRVGSDVTTIMDNYNAQVVQISNSINELGLEYLKIQDEINKTQDKIVLLTNSNTQNAAATVAEINNLKNLLTQYQNQLAQLDSDINILESTKAELSFINSALAENKNEVDAAIVKLRVDLQTVINNLDEQNKENSSKLKGYIEELQNICNGLDSEKVTIESFEQYKKKLNEEIDSLNRNSENELAASVSELNTIIASTDKKLEKYNNALLTKIEGNQSEVDKNVEKLKNSIEATIAELSADSDNKNAAAIAQMQSVYDELNTDKVNTDVFNEAKLQLKNAIQSLDADTALKTAALQGDISDVENSMNQLESSLNSRITDINLSVSAIERTINGNKAAADEAIANLNSALSTTIDNLNSKVDTNNENAVTAMNELKQLQTDLSTGKVSVSDYQSMVNKINNNINTLESTTGEQLDDVKMQISSANTALAEYKAAITNQLTTVNSDITNINSNIDSAIQGINANSTKISSVEQDVSANSTKISELESMVSSLKKSVSDGKKKVAATITEKGITTAAEDSIDTIVTNISSMATLQYNNGISFADGRVNTGSVNYKSGYNNGISDANNKLNTNSISYKTGYLDAYLIAVPDNVCSTAYTEEDNTLYYNVEKLKKIYFTFSSSYSENEDGESSGWAFLEVNNERIVDFGEYDDNDNRIYGGRSYSGVIDVSNMSNMQTYIKVRCTTNRWASATFHITKVE